MNNFVEITSKYKGSCKECAGTIDVGEKVLWQKGYGAKHLECIEQLDPINDPIAVEDMLDPSTHSYPDLQKIFKCQDCGADVSKLADRYIDDDRVVCEKHFGSNK